MRIKKDLRFCFAILLPLLNCFILSSCRQKDMVCLGSTCVRVEKAVNEQQRSRGLMYRRSLEKDRGMLFVFDNEDRYGFWMKNTRIPLDIIWIDSSGRIVHIARDVPPCKSRECPSYHPDSPARYVLEVNAGFCREHGISEDDTVTFR